MGIALPETFNKCCQFYWCSFLHSFKDLDFREVKTHKAFGTFYQVKVCAKLWEITVVYLFHKPHNNPLAFYYQYARQVCNSIDLTMRQLFYKEICEIYTPSGCVASLVLANVSIRLTTLIWPLTSASDKATSPLRALAFTSTPWIKSRVIDYSVKILSPFYSQTVADWAGCLRPRILTSSSLVLGRPLQ